MSEILEYPQLFVDDAHYCLTKEQWDEINKLYSRPLGQEESQAAFAQIQEKVKKWGISPVSLLKSKWYSRD